MDGEHRYVVWLGDQPMDTFPRVNGGMTPEELADRFEPGR